MLLPGYRAKLDGDAAGLTGASMSRMQDATSRVDSYRRNMDRRGLGVYFAKECQELGAFFAIVERYLPRGSRLLECGYGPGALSIYLSRCGYKIVGIDMDPDVIELAHVVNNALGGAVDYRVCDIYEIDKKFGPDSFDAVISDVTLEHYSDKEIIEALKRQLIVAELNIFAVHCANLLPKFFSGLDGGERLLKPTYWEDLVKRAGGRVVDRFGYGFYVTRMGQLNWRIPIIAERIFFRRLARFAAVIGFVVTRQKA